MENRKKTNHQPGYRKPIKNPTTNYPPDKHSDFCERCMRYNRMCPSTGTKRRDRLCSC